MSADATAYVFRHSPFKASTFQVHLAIADSVNDQHNNEFFMAVSNLAKKARVTRRTAQVALRQLERAGFLHLLAKEDGEVRRYHFEFCPQPVVFEGRGRNFNAPPAQSTARRGRSYNAQTQEVTQMNARGASHEEHFSPGSGVIKRFPRSGSNTEEAG